MRSKIHFLWFLKVKLLLGQLVLDSQINLLNKLLWSRFHLWGTFKVFEFIKRLQICNQRICSTNRNLEESSFEFEHSNLECKFLLKPYTVFLLFQISTRCAFSKWSHWFYTCLKVWQKQLVWWLLREFLSLYLSLCSCSQECWYHQDHSSRLPLSSHWVDLLRNLEINQSNRLSNWK